MLRRQADQEVIELRDGSVVDDDDDDDDDHDDTMERRPIVRDEFLASR